MKAPWFTDLAHGVVHLLLFLFPEEHARRIHDWHAQKTFGCSAEEAASGAPREGATAAFFRGVIVGALLGVAAWLLRSWLANGLTPVCALSLKVY